MTTQCIDGLMTDMIRVAVDPALKALVLKTCEREGDEVSEILRKASVDYLRTKGIEVEVVKRRPGRPKKVKDLAA